MDRLVVCAWIANGGWIYSRAAWQDSRFWIRDGWIWGPQGAADEHTGYWIADNWIFGPEGAEDATTGFFIQGDWIYGPRVQLPFVDDADVVD